MDDLDKLADKIEELAHSLQEEESNYIMNSELSRLSSTQMHYIDLIYHEQNPSLSDLARILSVSKPSVTLTVEKLVEMELVMKLKSDEDRRSSHLHLTKRGKKLARIHDDFHKQYTRIVFGDLPGEDVRTLLTILNKVLASSQKGREKQE